MKTQIEQLRDCVAIQCSSGNWNYDPYMHGMANGMIFALAVMEGVEPKYLDAPKEWLRDQRIEAPSQATTGKEEKWNS